MIGEVKDSASIFQSQTSDKQAKSNKQGAAAAQTEEAKISDTVELGSSQRSASMTYTRTSRKLSSSEIASLKDAADQAYANLRTLVEQMLKKQGSASKKASASPDIDLGASQQAKLSISEDGEFGVKAVSDRIVDFAVAISGGDKAKYEELKAAIDKGFQLASKSLGGSLPDISQQTYDEVMRKLDEWKNDDGQA